MLKRREAILRELREELGFKSLESDDRKVVEVTWISDPVCKDPGQIHSLYNCLGQADHQNFGSEICRQPCCGHFGQ